MKVKIGVDSGWDDCEDCGSYDYEHVTVVKDGEVVLDRYADNHLGGGMWYDWDEAVKEVLEALGIEVEIQK